MKLNFFRFGVEYRSNVPSDKDKARFGELDFPVYLLGREHGWETVEDLMKKHGAPKTIEKQDVYKAPKKIAGRQRRDGVVAFRRVGVADLGKLALSKHTRYPGKALEIYG